MLSRAEERLLVALRAAGPGPELAAALPELAPALDLVAATESFEAEPGRWDARIGPFALTGRPWAVTALESLGNCPLRFFFGQVLRIGELDEEAEAYALAPRDLGAAAHTVLERLFSKLDAEGLLDPAGEAAERRADELLPELWRETLEDPRSRMGRRAPALVEAFDAIWLASLRSFVREDLRRLRDERWGRPRLELAVTRRLDLPDGRSLEVRGRFDRLHDSDGRALVFDYKTGRVDFAGSTAEMLKARQLQMPLYRLLAGGGATVELLGVGPRHDPARGAAARRARFSGFDRPSDDDVFARALATLADLLENGTFPFREDWHCRWCPYPMACRRSHPPTVEREERAADGEAFRRLGRRRSRAEDAR